jgi:hypothetical protein
LELGAGKRILLKYTLKKQDWRVWAGFVWLRDLVNMVTNL